MKKTLLISSSAAIILFSVNAIAQEKAVIVPIQGYFIIPICELHRDCNGDCGGSAYLDSCNFCVGGNTGIISQYNCVKSAGQLWIDRNLGASRVATSSADSAAYGDLYQWGRLEDGHESRTSSTIGTQSNIYDPGHSNFIIGFFDWLNPSNDNLWQDSGINNPCPAGFRVPTKAEWNIEKQSWSSNNPDGAFASPLKLVIGGYRTGESGTIKYVDLNGSYWSSTTDGGSGAEGLQIYTGGNAGVYTTNRAYGMSIRCIRTLIP